MHHTEFTFIFALDERQTWNGILFAFLFHLRQFRINPKTSRTCLFRETRPLDSRQLNNSPARSACCSLFNRNVCRLSVTHSGIHEHEHVCRRLLPNQTSEQFSIHFEGKNKMPMILIALDIFQASFRIDTIQMESEYKQLATS